MSSQTKNEEFKAEVAYFPKKINLEFSSPKNTRNFLTLSQIYRKTRVMDELIESSLNLIDIIQAGWDNRDKRLGFWLFFYGKASLNFVKNRGWSSRYWTDLLGI